jgi:NAD(P)-dependent dehydrogenase (short-subunit alcohol dehydrogenase family)
LTERAALITGGSRGIGLAIGRALGQDGHGVTLSSRRPEKLEAAAQSLRDEGLDVTLRTTMDVLEAIATQTLAALEHRTDRLYVANHFVGPGVVAGGPVAARGAA